MYAGVPIIKPLQTPDRIKSQQSKNDISAKNFYTDKAVERKIFRSPNHTRRTHSKANTARVLCS